MPSPEPKDFKSAGQQVRDLFDMDLNAQRLLNKIGSDAVVTWRESYSETFFKSSFIEVLKAEYYLNRLFSMRGCVTIADFLDLLGAEPIDDFDDYGWEHVGDDDWIDFCHKAKLEPGDRGYISYIEISYLIEPYGIDLY